MGDTHTREDIPVRKVRVINKKKKEKPEEIGIKLKGGRKKRAIKLLGYEIREGRCRMGDS